MRGVSGLRGSCKCKIFYQNFKCKTFYTNFSRFIQLTENILCRNKQSVNTNDFHLSIVAKSLPRSRFIREKVKEKSSLVDFFMYSVFYGPQNFLFPKIWFNFILKDKNVAILDIFEASRAIISSILYLIYSWWLVKIYHIYNIFNSKLRY